MVAEEGMQGLTKLQGITRPGPILEYCHDCWVERFCNPLSPEEMRAVEWMNETIWAFISATSGVSRDEMMAAADGEIVNAHVCALEEDDPEES